MRYYQLKEEIPPLNSIKIERNCLEKSKQFMDIVINGKFDKNTIITDYIKRKGFYQTNYLFSDKIKKIFNSYPDQMGNRVVIITDIQQNKQFVYWDIKYKVIECIIFNSLFDSYHIQLEGEKINNANFFIARKNNQEYLIVRFDIAEQIMKTLPIGIKFYPVQVN